jgi:hypothetical protein
MRFASIPFALLLTSSVALAQSGGWQFPALQLDSKKPTHKLGQSSGWQFLTPDPTKLTGACPVGLRAQRQGSTSLIVVDGKTQRPIGPAVRLTVNNLQGKNIVGATMRVSGYGTRPQLLPIRGVSSTSDEMTKTVSVKLDVVQGKSGQTDVTAEKFGGISRIYLELVEYSDGTVWRANQEQPCSVEPDLLMLVADR